MFPEDCLKEAFRRKLYKQETLTSQSDMAFQFSEGGILKVARKRLTERTIQHISRRENNY